jgi:hypothetical protein
MPIVRYVRKQFDIPDEGLHDAVISEFRDLGMITGFNGQKQAKLQAIYELDELGSNGEPLKVFQRFNNTLHPQSFLYKAITDITGALPGEEYDTDKLIGRRVQLLIKHNEGANGVVYANVENILRPKTKDEEASEKRIQDTTGDIKAQQKSGPVRKPPVIARTPQPMTATADENHEVEIDDSDIPF